jgi:Tfp pilus assembly protein PilO
VNPAASTRNWSIGGAVVIIVVVALGFFLGVQPQLQAAQIAQRDLADVEAQNDLKRLELEALKQQFAALPEVQAKLDAIRLSVPADASIETFTTQLAALVAAAGVTLQTFSTTSPIPFVASDQAAPLIPTEVDGLSYVVVPFQLSAVGPREGLVSLVAAIQNGERLALVNRFAISNGGDDQTVGLDLSGLLYVYLDEPATPTEAAPVEPVPTPAP